MGNRKNIKQKKNKRGRKILSTLEEVYNRAWFLEKKGELRKCKSSVRRFRSKDRSGNKKTREAR